MSKKKAEPVQQTLGDSNLLLIKMDDVKKPRKIMPRPSHKMEDKTKYNRKKIKGVQDV